MKKRESQTRKPWRLLLAITVSIVIAGVWLGFYLHDKDVSVLAPQGIIGAQQRDLIMFTSILSVFVIVPVFAMLGWFAWKYREDNTKAEYRPDEDGNHWLEVLWWGIPILIIVILSVITWITTHQLDPQRPIDSNVKPVKVQVVALQWKWLFLYPEQKVATVNELKIPAGTPINFYITADAPMSAFWIPSLGTQVYAMNGMTARLNLQADNPGTYRGVNTNINGEGYSDMHFKVSSIEPRDFNLWAKTLAGSTGDGEMNWSAYEVLAKPETKGAVSYHRFADLSLYGKIVDKYAHSHSGGSPDKKQHKEGSH